MLTKNIKNMKSEIAKHIKADAVIQGEYWDEDRGKGCFIGCLSHAQYAGVVSEKYGIPNVLVSLLENIFESLPKKDAVSFFSDIGDAISVDNKDLSLVHYAFLRDMLKRLPEISETTQAVIAGLYLLSQGKNWPEQEAVSAAADAALDASDTSAAWAAVEAVRSAAYWAAEGAADASVDRKQERKLQVTTILQLLKDAPIMEDRNA